jgi:hypothetical protein
MDLERVKEHFKNAKEVRCLADGNVYKIKDDTTYCAVTFWCLDINSYGVRLYAHGKFAEIISYKEEITTPEHYNNENGTLYKVAAQRNWNPYLFDIVKRLERADKKGEFESDLNKSIAVIQLWLKESKNDN